MKGEKVKVKLKFSDPAVDSVVYSVDGEIFDRKTDSAAVLLDTHSYSNGNKGLSAKVYSEGKEGIAYTEILVVLLSLKQYAFEVVNTYPHDQGAFTQGLFLKTELYMKPSVSLVNIPCGKLNWQQARSFRRQTYRRMNLLKG